MGVLGFLFGLGKSREEKMAIFVLGKAQQELEKYREKLARSELLIR